MQVRRGIGGLSVHLPTHRDVNGAWKPVVEMPEELRGPLSDAVMGFLVDEGIAKPRCTGPKPDPSTSSTLRWNRMPALLPAAAMSAGAA